MAGPEPPPDASGDVRNAWLFNLSLNLFVSAFILILVSVALELVLGMVFALVLNETMPGRGFLRVVVLVPWAIPIAVSARIWELVNNFDFGQVNVLLQGVGLTRGPINWLGSSTGAFAVLIPWKSVAGFATPPPPQAAAAGRTDLQPGCAAAHQHARRPQKDPAQTGRHGRLCYP